MKKSLYQEYLDAVEANARPKLKWRWGQNMFNTLHTLHPNIANEIRGTTLDPFHKSGKDLEPFIMYIKRRLNES